MLTALIIVLIVIMAVVALVASRPNQFRIERSTTIQAPSERVFAAINDLHSWQAWSPWEKKDPNMQRSFDGPGAGKGASYSWNGNKDIGTGRMEISESTPSSRIVIKLEFFTPFKASNTAEFQLQPRDGGTHVVWAMYGPSNFMSKLMGLVFNMDKMVGKDFEEGLGNLRRQTED